MAAHAMKTEKDDLHETAETDAEGWAPHVVQVIDVTSRRFARGEISDQKAFDMLLKAGVPEHEATALLRTFMLVSAL